MLRRALTLAVFLLGPACSMPEGPSASEAEIAGIERSTIVVPGAVPVCLSYLRAGSRKGRRVIFVHGTPGNAQGWADFLLNVPAGTEYIAIDRPGFGATTPHNAVPSIERQAMVLGPLLEARHGGLPILVGHSLGGPIVARAAIDFPGRIGGLIILAGSLDPALEKVHPMQPVGEWCGVRSLLPRALRNANRELLALEPELAAMAPLLDRIDVPVTIVHGTADTLVPVANVAFMKRHFVAARSLRIETLPGQNHFLPWERRPVIEAAIAAMVDA